MNAGDVGTIELRILGPLEVHREGRLVLLPSGQAPQLLGLLLLHAGRLVRHELLTQVLWGEDPPASARKLIQVRLSQLRRLVGPAVDIRGTREGYRLAVPQGALDLHRFRQLVSDAAGQSPEVEEGLLRRALDLWRGPALVELRSTTRGMRLADALEEEHLAAVEAHAAAALATGRLPELVPALTQALADHPLRESLRAQLMLALHRSGRQADALSSFEEGRRLLADELGVDPGRELRDAHAAILAGGDLLATAAIVPRQLPPAPDVFIGREAESAALLAAVRDNAATAARLAVHGPGGQGKSTLVLRVAHRLTDHFPDGQLYADLLGSTPGATPVAPEDVLRRFVRAFGVPQHSIPEATAELVELYRSMVAGKRLLVVLDNAVDSSQVTSLLPTSSGSAVLITSRRMLATVDARQVALEPLAEDDSVDLFIGHTRRSFTADERADASRIAQVCGYLPLALRIAAAKLSARPDWTMADLLARLTDQRRRLDELNIDNLAVRSSVELSYRYLDEGAARAFRLLGLLPLPYFSIPVVGALLSRTDTDADRMLGPLVQARLVEVTAPGRYRLHDLVRLFALEQAERNETASDRDAAVTRVLGHYRARLDEAHARLRPHTTAANTATSGRELPEISDSVRWISDEIENLVAAARFAADVSELAPQALKIAHHLRLYLWDREMRTDVIEVAQIATRAADRLGTDEAIGAALDIQALINQRLSRLGEAHAQYIRLLAHYKRCDDLPGQGRALGNIGILLREMGRLDEALRCLEQAGELFEKHGPRDAQPLVHACIADVHLQAGRYDAALSFAEQSLELSHDRDPTCESYALVALGQVHCQLGNLEDSLAWLDKCVDLCRQLNTQHDEWEALLVRSEVQLRRQDPDAAVNDAYRVLELLSGHVDYYGQGAAHRQISRALKMLGKDQAAANHESTATLLLNTPNLHRNRLLESVLTGSQVFVGNAVQKSHAETTDQSLPDRESLE
ncbi:BTAD domain-containing putative transcriptional regulator [Saccharomonospora sp. NPDC046836]|uniref:AfsR/SARP family transcriptional regulator n=1 Tax=Saccharomonospora sp. NPDC046836 TaxID=3156921 RepID=UPI0033E472B6